jgi:hypothetical protein
MHRHRSNEFWPFICVAIFAPVVARAGMAMPTFTDIARARLDVLSFFLVGYLVLAFVYQWLWNSFARDFSRMPRLSYRGAVGALVVCGLFIYVVLTMISGARELLTPGAWARSGVMYKIREPDRDPKPWLETARRTSLERLRAGLWQYAEQHEGKFPTSRDRAEMPQELWRSIDPEGRLLGYVPGAKRDVGAKVIAYEPGSFGATRKVLLSDGTITDVNAEELTRRVREQIQGMDRNGEAMERP